MPKMSYFSRFFGKKNRKEGTEATGNVETVSSTKGVAQRIGNRGTKEQLMEELRAKIAAGSASQEAAEGDAAAEAQTEEAGVREDSIEALYRKLQTSKRGGFHLHSGNSALYNQVMNSMGGILYIMKQRFSTDTHSNLKQFNSIQAEYQRLINACEDYLNRSASTTKGQIRQAIVKNILETAQRDIIGISGVSMEFASLAPEKQADKTWAEVMDQARVTNLSVDDLFKADRAEGGVASEVIRFKPNTITIRKNDGTESQLSGTYFFKPEDEMDLEQATFALKIVDSVLARYQGLTQEEQEKIRNWASRQYMEGEAIMFVRTPSGLSKQGMLALETIKSKVRGTKVTYDNLLTPSGIASEGGKVNMTKRNVATSRMAALLGLEHLVAKSYTAELLDKATGQTIRGNMMEQAKGMSPTDFYFAYTAHEKEKGVTEEKPAPVHNLVQRDLLNLQVLDVLCGQMDRHMQNVMMQTDENYAVTGIMGIDNDGSFGLNTDVVASEMHERFDKRVYDPETGEIVLPYMDKNLAQRILKLEPDVVRFSLKGLITDQEIEAAVQRLNIMKSAIQKTSKDRFLEDSQWNQKTAQAIFTRGWEADKELITNTDDEVVKLVGEWDPRFKDVIVSELTPEDRAQYMQLKYKAMDEINARLHNRYLSEDNYFTEFMMTIMGTRHATDKIPQIAISNTQKI